MTYLQRVWEALEAGLWRFIRLIHNANHDYPYHDYTMITGTATDSGPEGVYAVGTNNVDAHGDQTKRFVSKRANMWTDDSATLVRFNDSRNVAISLPFSHGTEIDENEIWQKEFYTNITAVYYTVPNGKHLWMYFEGVLPEEARDAE